MHDHDPPRRSDRPRLEGGRRPTWGGVLLVLAGLAWAATMARLVAVEMLDPEASEDVRALVDRARLHEAHATARYEVRAGAEVVGELRSTVSGGQREDQLAYVLSAELRRPRRVRVQGFVLADWARRPRRFVVEVTVEGERHRVEGGLVPRGDGDVLFEARYLPPPGGEGREATWVLPHSPVLAPGPLPVPEIEWAAASGERATGVLADPLRGQPIRWVVTPGEPTTFELSGRARPALRHELSWGAVTVVVVTEPDGFPLRLELPLGFAIVLVEEKR